MARKCIFIPDLNGGGAEKVLLNLCYYSQSKGDIIDIVLLNDKGDYKLDDSYRGKINILGVDSDKKWILSLLVSFRLLKVLSKYDVIFTGIFYCNLLSVISSLFSSRIIITSQHTVKSVKDLRRNWFVAKSMRILTKYVYSKSSKTVCVSDYIKNDLENNYGIAPKKLITIYNPVFIQCKFDRTKKNPNITRSKIRLLCVGRLIHDKGFDIAIRVVKCIKDSGFEVTLDIVGAGSELTQLEDLAVKLHVDKEVNFLGFHRDIDSFYTSADVLLVPSRLEGFGNVVVEALSFGLPVVVSNSPGGLSEIVNSINVGSVVELDERKLATSVVDEFCNDTIEKSKMRTARAKEFSKEVLYSKYLELVHE